MTGMQRRLFRLGNRVSVWLYRTSGGRLFGKARGLPDDPQWFRNLEGDRHGRGGAA